MHIVNSIGVARNFFSGRGLAIEAPYAPRPSEDVDGEELERGFPLPTAADGDYRGLESIVSSRSHQAQ